MSDLKSAAKLALEVLKDSQDYKMGRAMTVEATEALEEALAEQHLQDLHDENVRLGLYEHGEPVAVTKTWFEDGKVVTQHLAAKDIYKEPEQISTRPWFTIDELSEWIDKYQNQEWRNAAIMLGEKLSSVGPVGYYNMEAKDWLDWAMLNIQSPQPKQDNTYVYASSLATAIWQKHYMKESPKFALLDTTEGVLTQIDNMTCGLVREKPAQSEQAPVAWMKEGWLHRCALYYINYSTKGDREMIYTRFHADVWFLLPTVAIGRGDKLWAEIAWFGVAVGIKKGGWRK
jgi:hypothetical protein